MTAIFTATPTHASAPGTAAVIFDPPSVGGVGAEVTLDHTGQVLSTPNGGWFLLSLRVSMLPRDPVHHGHGLARLAFVRNGSDMRFVMDAPIDSTYTLANGSLVFHSNPGDTWRLECSSPVPVYFNNDARATQVAIVKL